MPIYEYKCVDCGNKTEAMQKISDAPLTVCPKCAGKLEKQWSLSGFQFKGSGWYVSDYANRGKESTASGETATKPGESNGGDAVKIETKAEPTAAAPVAPGGETKAA